MEALYRDYTTALDSHPAGALLLDEPLDEGTVRSNLQGGKYAESAHLLYTDLKTAASKALSHQEISSPEYNKLNSVFQFAVDLLLREAARLSQLEPSGPENTGDHFMQTISAAFNKVFADADETYGESLFALTSSGPVFTSVTGRTSIDPRDTTVHGTVHSTKLLPHIASTPEVTLGFASPMNARIPHASSQPTDILGTFTAPNQTPLPHPRWIEQPVYGSFAPTRDGNGAFVPVEDATAVYETKKDFVNEKPEVQEQDRPKRGESRHLSPAPGDEIDIAALLRWAPSHFVDNDEMEAATNGTEVELVSQLLLELQYMQRERLAAPGIELEMGDDEWRTALKAQNVLARLLADNKPETKLSTKMPVLIHNYAGVLPNVDPKPSQLNRFAPQVRRKR